jgi:hypothetical protein
MPLTPAHELYEHWFDIPYFQGGGRVPWERAEKRESTKPATEIRSTTAKQSIEQFRAKVETSLADIRRLEEGIRRKDAESARLRSPIPAIQAEHRRQLLRIRRDHQRLQAEAMVARERAQTDLRRERAPFQYELSRVRSEEAAAATYRR